jgi:hypothetical protein
MVSIIFWAILGYVCGTCGACIYVIERQHTAIKQASNLIKELRRENRSLFNQHLKDNGIHITELNNHEH